MYSWSYKMITALIKVKFDSSFFIQERLRYSKRERERERESLRSTADNIEAGAFKITYHQDDNNVYISRKRSFQRRT